MVATRVIAQLHSESPRALSLHSGRSGVHTSRTMMFKELSILLQRLPIDASRTAFQEAVINDNVLGKTTISSRKRTFEHLVSLYVLDPTAPIFRLLRHFWQLDATGRPLICLVAARARDNLLQLGTDFILPLKLGSVYNRAEFEIFISDSFPGRFSEKMRRSLAQNIAATFTQAGFLKGKVKKIRVEPHSSVGAVSLALAVTQMAGDLGRSPWDSPCFRILGLTRATGESLAREASRRGWIEYSQLGEAQALSFRHLAHDLRVMELS